MTPGPRNAITDVPGLRVGQAQESRLKSGVSVVLGDAPFVAAVHVMGGAPGTRETDLLAPENTVEAVDALVLSGGSAFGLGAADGVVGWLREHGRGFEAAGHRVPIVPAAILFDLTVGDTEWTTSPYPALGREAAASAGLDVALGRHGAGMGATTADLMSGVGTASVVLPSGITVGALVAVNAVGSVVADADGRFHAAAQEIGKEFGGLGVATVPDLALRTKLSGATTLAVVATDAALTKAQAKRMAVAAHDGFARAIWPAHTPYDGDLIFAASTGAYGDPGEDLWLLGHHAATCLSRAVARGVYAAEALEGDPLPTWRDRFGSGGQ